jgi:hypothetical protein
MKNKALKGKVLLWVMLMNMPLQAFAWDWRTKVTLSIQDQPLQLVCELLEQQYGIHFSYSRDIVNLSRKVTVNVRGKQLKDLLDDIFSPYDIHYARIGQQIVLTVKKQRTVSGYVQDVRTGERLIGATIYSPAQREGTFTNQYGFFSLTLPKDTCSLLVTYVGYCSFKLPVAGLSKKQVIITLQPLNSLREVVVTDAQLSGQPGQIQMSRINVPLSDVKSMPRLLGEADVMRTIAALPGVSGGLDGGGSLNVRGGSPDQNLILLDGTPVFNSSHLLGIFSVFNPDIVKSADFYKGAFPARYGGRLSSIVDISTKDGDMQHVHGEAAIGLIAAKAMVEGPIVKDKTSFVVSARRSYTDLLMNEAYVNQDNEEQKNTAYIYFYDTNVKLNHIFSSKDRVYFSGYTGKDKFNLKRSNNIEDTRTNLAWGNTTGTLRWNHIFNPRLFANATLNYSEYSFSTSYNYDYTPDSIIYTTHQYGKYYSRIKDAMAKIDFEYRPNPDHTLKFGTGFVSHIFNPGVSLLQTNSAGQAPLDTSYNDDPFKGKEMFLYGEDEWAITSALQINAGVHISGFVVDGNWYNSVQPRLGARYQLPRNWTLKASYTHMNQYLHLLTNSGTSLPTDLWVPSTSKVKPEFSKQTSFGITKMSKNNVFCYSLEGYYKTMDNVIEYKDNASLINTSGKKWDELVEVGRGRSYGGEVLLEKKKGLLKGWIGYTLSWSERQFSNVNDGEAFPYKYDRRHDLEVVVTRQLGKRWEVSASWEYTSGMPLTLPTASYEGATDSPWDIPANPPILDHISKRNQFRSKDLHRLDLSATYTKQKRLWVKSWTFSLYNAYNQQNPLYYTVVTDRVKQERYLAEVSILPILPSVTYAIKF